MIPQIIFTPRMLLKRTFSAITWKNTKLLNGNALFSSSSNVSFNLAGIYPPIITTFDDSGDKIAYEKLSSNLEKWKEIPFRGYVVLGSTGEFVSLLEDEKLKLVKSIKEKVSKEKLIFVGTGSESTMGTIELTNKMADIGADAALVVSPFFYKGRMTEDTLYDHYVKVAECSRIPIILYSVPANTGIDLPASLIERLSQHPNIVGLKDSGGDIAKISLIVHKTKASGFQVLAGSAGFLYPALSVGCVGGVLALANPLGAQCCRLLRLFREGRREEAALLQHRLLEPNLAVTRRFGIAGVKAAMDLLGYEGGACRAPLRPLSTPEREELRGAFAEFLPGKTLLSESAE